MDDVQIFALLQFWIYQLFVCFSHLYIQYEIFQLFLQQLLNLGLVKNPRQYTREKGCLKKVQCLGSIAVLDEVPVLNCGRKHNPVLASEMDPFGSVYLHLSG